MYLYMHLYTCSRCTCTCTCTCISSYIKYMYMYMYQTTANLFVPKSRSTCTCRHTGLTSATQSLIVHSSNAFRCHGFRPALCWLGSLLVPINYLPRFQAWVGKEHLYWQIESSKVLNLSTKTLSTINMKSLQTSKEMIHIHIICYVELRFSCIMNVYGKCTGPTTEKAREACYTTVARILDSV